MNPCCAAIGVGVCVLALAGCGREDIAPTIRTVNRTSSILPVRATGESHPSEAAIALAAFNLPDRTGEFDLTEAATFLFGGEVAAPVAFETLPCADLVAPASELTLTDIASAIATTSTSQPWAGSPALVSAISHLIPQANVDVEEILRLPDRTSPCGLTASTPTPMAVRSAVGEAIAFSCTDSEADIRAKGGQSITVGRTTLFIGYQQVSSNNQDPRFIRFDNGKRLWCRDDYESTGDDSQGYGLVWDGDRHLYAVFSSTGTQGSPTEDFREFSREGWLRSYGRGGGAKVAVLARIEPETGDVEAATFLSAQLSNGNSNTLVVRELDWVDAELSVRADAFYSPRTRDRSPFRCEGKSPFDYSVRFTSDLAEVTQASVRKTDTSSCR